MTAKELRQSLRRGSFVIPFLAIHVLAVAAMAVEFKVGQTGASSSYTGVFNVALFAEAGPFWWVVSAVCLVIMPLGGVILMGQELEEGNHELLLLTKLDRWRIVFGKFITLWGLCGLTFISLLPYVVVRYLVGGIEWGHEAACGGTILGGSAMLCAGAIGASAFVQIAARIGVLVLFVASVGAGCGIPLAFCAMRSSGCGWIYHFTALAAVLAYVAVGLALARSRLRLSIFPFEVNPSAMILGLLVFAPFVVGMVTAMTGGWGGAGGLLGLAIIAWKMDITPKAQKSVMPPLPNVPATGG